MSSSWYGEIDNWFEQYRFDTQVVYALFNECKRRSKLDSKAYVSKVALNWSNQGIVTYDDLNRYFLSYDKVTRISKKIGQKLKKNITEYDEEIITKWVSKMGYDFEIIEIVLKKISKLANPNLEYANKLLEEWFSMGLRSVDTIKSYEEEKREKYFQGKNNKGKTMLDNNAKAANVGNFEQREYSEDYFEQMIENVTDIAEDQQGGKLL